MIEPHILKLPTPRLLAFYKKHYRRPNPYSEHHYYYYSYTYDVDAYNQFEADCNTVKDELSRREHVER